MVPEVQQTRHHRHLALGRAKAHMNHAHILSAVSAGPPNLNTKEKEKLKANMGKKKTKEIKNSLLIRNYCNRNVFIALVSLNTIHIFENIFNCIFLVRLSTAA